MLIGLIGNKQCGKSTFADYLDKEYKFSQVAFADPIKQGVKIFFDFSDEQMEGVLKEVVDTRWGISPRTALQQVGTNVFRQFLPKTVKGLSHLEDTFWIERFKIWYRKHKDENILVSDIRFPNEAKLISDMGGVLIKIDRKGVKSNDKHISESLVDKIKYDCLIQNDYSIKEYYEHIDILMSNIMNDVHFPQSS